MKKVLVIFLSVIMVVMLTGCEDYINRSYTAEEVSERFDGLFVEIGDILKKYDIPFDVSNVSEKDSKECISRSFDHTFENGDSFSVWLTYTFNGDGTGKETFYCGMTTSEVDSFSEAYINAEDYRYVFEVGHCLSNMSGTDRMVRRANKLVETVKERVLTELGSPPGGIYSETADLSNEYDLWDIGYSVQYHSDTQKYDSTFVCEGLLNA